MVFWVPSFRVERLPGSSAERVGTGRVGVQGLVWGDAGESPP